MSDGWFTVWMWASNRILDAQQAVLRWGCPVRPRTTTWHRDVPFSSLDLGATLKAIAALQFWLFLSWWYHRALDLAAVGI